MRTAFVWIIVLKIDRSVDNQSAHLSFINLAIEFSGCPLPFRFLFVVHRFFFR